MSVFIITPAAVLWVLSWLSAPPASLADAALREAMRRQSTPKSAAVLTNLGQPLEAPPPGAVTLPPPPDPPPPPPPDVMPPPPPTPPAATDPAKDEQWWRARIASARKAIDKDQLAAEATQTRINALQRDAVNLDDPGQQAKARQDLGKALGELERLKLQIELDRTMVAAINEEARRLNVPPGWLR